MINIKTPTDQSRRKKTVEYLAYTAVCFLFWFAFLTAGRNIYFTNFEDKAETVEAVGEGLVMAVFLLLGILAARRYRAIFFPYTLCMGAYLTAERLSVGFLPLARGMDIRAFGNVSLVLMDSFILFAAYMISSAVAGNLRTGVRRF